MNRRNFIKGISTVVVASVSGVNLVMAKEHCGYTFIRVFTPGDMNGNQLWIIRPHDLKHPIVPTHKNNLPYQPPTIKKCILHNQPFDCLKVGDYRRNHIDVYSHWDKVIETGYSLNGRMWIKTERIFLYDPNESNLLTKYKKCGRIAI